jgi:serine/threonine-protein kinase RsbW
MRSIAFPGRFASLNEIRDYYTQAAKEARLNKKSIHDVQLAVDEAASNIINHAYGGEDKGEIECSYQVEPGKLEVVMRDHGKPFDPETVKPPDLKTDVSEREMGGLGLHFMRALMDRVEFTFNGQGGNILRMVKTDKDPGEEKDEENRER